MKWKTLVCLLVAVCALGSIPLGALASEVDSDDVYCFTTQDFSQQEDLQGICITGLPDAKVGTMFLGNRILREGDILSAQQVMNMTFLPIRTTEDSHAVVEFLPIYENRVERAATMELLIRGKVDKAPVAEDMALETYKNLPNEGVLKASDPEGQTLTYTILRQPKRGQVQVDADGRFVYTPKKNKVGVDSFTYNATDPAGNVSREATVTVQILKPTDGRQYTDTVGQDCRFEAEWLRNTGLFVAESVGGQSCFQPEKTVSRGEFIAMMVKALEMNTDNTNYESLQEAPQWLRPYLGAAMRSGLISQWPQEQSGNFDAPITGAEAAVAVQSALDLQVSEAALETFAGQELPEWAVNALAAMADNGVEVPWAQSLTRADCARMLYQVSRLAVTAPGMEIIRNGQ